MYLPEASSEGSEDILPVWLLTDERKICTPLGVIGYWLWTYTYLWISLQVTSRNIRLFNSSRWVPNPYIYFGIYICFLSPHSFWMYSVVIYLVIKFPHWNKSCYGGKPNWKILNCLFLCIEILNWGQFCIPAELVTIVTLIGLRVAGLVIQSMFPFTSPDWTMKKP